MEKECNNRKYKNPKRFIIGIISILLAIGAGVSNRLIDWVFKTWPHLSAEELLYQLTAPVEGTNQGMILDAVKHCVPMMVLGAVLAIALYNFVKKKRKFFGANT